MSMGKTHPKKERYQIYRAFRKREGNGQQLDGVLGFSALNSAYGNHNLRITGKVKDSQNKSLIRQAHLPLSCASGIAVQAETISHFDPIALSLGWLPLAFLAPLLPFPCHFFYRAPQGYSGSRPHRNDPAQAPSPRGIVVITVVLDHLLAFVWDMGAHGGEPL